jgi:hypothetical protein
LVLLFVAFFGLVHEPEELGHTDLFDKGLDTFNTGKISSKLAIPTSP